MASESKRLKKKRLLEYNICYRCDVTHSFGLAQKYTNFNWVIISKNHIGLKQTLGIM